MNRKKRSPILLTILDHHSLIDSDGMVWFQGRSLNPKDKMRYITDVDDDKTKIYGQEQINPNSLCHRGPFDSYFLANVAMCGSDVDHSTLPYRDRISFSTTNPEAEKLLLRLRERSSGEKVVIWLVISNKKT